MAEQLSPAAARTRILGGLLVTVLALVAGTVFLRGTGVGRLDSAAVAVAVGTGAGLGAGLTYLLYATDRGDALRAWSGERFHRRLLLGMVVGTPLAVLVAGFGRAVVYLTLLVAWVTHLAALGVVYATADA